MINIQRHDDMFVLRDDLLLGGTKSTFVGKLLDRDKDSHVYATPAYGGFQIALAAVCKVLKCRAVIFVAKRKKPHPNTLKAKELGATVYQVPFGYLSVVQSKAKEYCRYNNGQYLEFGAKNAIGLKALEKRTKSVIEELGFEPDKIFCAVGSGTLLNGIIRGTTTAQIIGVVVGKKNSDPLPSRVTLIEYPNKFDQPAKVLPPFPSCVNYDAKVWVYAKSHSRPGERNLFWNVLD